MELSCVQFGYWMMGSTGTTLSVYIDNDGGVPDTTNMQLLYTFPVTTINAVGQMQVQTVTADGAIPINFENEAQTLVVVLNVPLMSEGLMQGGGQWNEEVVGTFGETYVSGGCMTGFVSYSEFALGLGQVPYDAATQWYVRLHSVPKTSKNSNDDDSSLSTGALIGISIAAAVAGIAIIAGVVYCIFFRGSKNEMHSPLV